MASRLALRLHHRCGMARYGRGALPSHARLRGNQPLAATADQNKTSGFCHVKGQGGRNQPDFRFFPYDITHARLVCWGVGGCLPGRWPPLSCVCGICCCEAPRTSCRCPPPRSSGDGGPFPPPANPGATAALFSYACHLGLAWKAACISPVWRRRAGRHVGGRHGASRPFQRAGRAWQAQRARRPRPRSAASS